MKKNNIYCLANPNICRLNTCAKEQFISSSIFSLLIVSLHVNIDGNEQADKLAKEGLELEHRIAIHPHEHAHATPYYYQKDVWASMTDVPDKGPVRFLEKQIIKYDRETTQK